MNKTKYFLGLFLLGFGALSLPTFAVPPIALNSGNVATYCTTGKGWSALLCTDSSIDSISWNTFISYPNVLDINLSNNLLSNLPNWLFSGMSSLVSINLSGNQISSIETGAFYNLPAMLNIHLDNNSIDGATLDLTTLGYFNTRQPDWQSLQVVYGCIDNILANNYNPLATQDNGTCDGNTILNSGNIWRLCGVWETDCYVQGVWITSIDEDTFVDYGDLTTLYIDDNQLSGLSIWVFSGLNNLTNLSLNNNVLTSLPDWVFSELSNLNYLYLNSNQLTSLPSWIFNWLYNLLEIEITNNPLSSLPIWLFSGLSNLNYLDINSNQITSLPKWIFSGLVNLNYLYIGYNQLSTLSSWVFNGLSGLTEIDISNNQITSVETGAFDNLPAMTYINLYNNSINGATLDATTLGYFNTRSPYRRTSQTISGCIDNKLANNYNQRAA